MKLTADELDKLAGMERDGKLAAMHIAFWPGKKKRKNHVPAIRIEGEYDECESIATEENLPDRKHGEEILRLLADQVRNKQIVSGVIRKHEGRWYLNYATRGT